MPNLLQIINKFNNCCNDAFNIIDKAIAEYNQTGYYSASSVAFTAVRLHDEWALRCRELVICSARGGFTTRTGTYLLSSNLSGKSILPYIRANWRDPSKPPMSWRWEPKWYMPDQASRCATILQTANASNISLGLGASIYADELRIVRNIIAHNLPDTWRKFREINKNSGIPYCSPTDFLLSRNQNTQLSLFEMYVIDLQDSLMAAAQ